MPNIGFLDTESNYRVLSVKDFQLQNLWGLSFYGTSPNYMLGPDFDFYVKETNIPLPQISVDKTDFDLILPEGKEEIGSYSITFIETVDFQGFKFFSDWLNNVYDFKKRVYKPKFHLQKKNATVKFLSLRHVGIPGVVPAMLPTANVVNLAVPTSFGVSVPNIYFDLNGIMIKGIEDISLGDDAGDPLLLTVNFEIQSITYRTVLNGMSVGLEDFGNKVSSLTKGFIK